MHISLFVLRTELQMSYEGAYVIMENYSIENKSSFHNDENWRKKLRLAKQMYS